MQLDIEVSPPANGAQMSNLQIHKLNHFLRYEFWSSHELWSSEFWSSHRRRDRQKVMHMSQPCISTGVLKN